MKKFEWALYWFLGICFNIWVVVARWERLEPKALWFLFVLSCAEFVCFLLVLQRVREDARRRAGDLGEHR